MTSGNAGSSSVSEQRLESKLDLMGRAVAWLDGHPFWGLGVSKSLEEGKCHVCSVVGQQAWSSEGGRGPEREGEALGPLAGKVDYVLNDSLGSLFCNKIGRNQKL